MLVDGKGNITVKTDAMRQALKYYKQLDPVPPVRRVFVGRFVQRRVAGLPSGGALIINPPTASAVAERDAPKFAEQQLDPPPCRRPQGRSDPFVPFFSASGVSPEPFVDQEP